MSFHDGEDCLMSNRLILISGTNRGLGKALKEKYINDNVIAINRTITEIEDIIVDLSDQEIDLELLKEKLKSYEEVVFISNASSIHPIELLINVTEKALEESIYTNYINPSKIILAIIQSHLSYVIVNITTGAVFTANSKLALYSASKSAMHRFIEILNKEQEDNPKALYIANYDPQRMQTDMQMNLIEAKDLTIDLETLRKPQEVADEIYTIVGQYI